MIDVLSCRRCLSLFRRNIKRNKRCYCGRGSSGFSHIMSMILSRRTILPVNFEIELQKKFTICMLAAAVMSVENIQLCVAFSCLLVSY